jgi:hypothetical protein
MKDDEIVHLASAVNPVEAHVWQQALEEEGIRSQVVGDYLDAGIGDMPGFRAEVWVHRDDVERARAILAAHQKARPEPQEEETGALQGADNEDQEPK